MSSSSDTIAAVASGLGECAVTLIRVSGPESLSVLRKVFPSFGREGSIPEPRVARLARAVDPGTGEVVDQCVVTCYPASRSYTGEDVLEIGCHGGWVTPSRVLSLLFSAGCRPAEPGEFSKRAFLNGKLSLSQAEAVAAVITAKSELAQRNAVRQLEGALGQRLEELAARLRDLTAELEASLDFDEHEVPSPDLDEAAQTLIACADETKALAESWQRGRLFMLRWSRVVILAKLRHVRMR